MSCSATLTRPSTTRRRCPVHCERRRLRASRCSALNRSGCRALRSAEGTCSIGYVASASLSRRLHAFSKSLTRGSSLAQRYTVRSLIWRRAATWATVRYRGSTRAADALGQAASDRGVTDGLLPDDQRGPSPEATGGL